ncbi:MAG: hypothetical protein OGMRLDGQ_000390, partial [Candidatus Fervidibacter sp.]
MVSVEPLSAVPLGRMLKRMRHRGPDEG